jgi:enoyl-[acyl-carrier protein] reductase I
MNDLLDLKNLPKDLLKGKKGVIAGIANNLSIAWPIAQFAKACGAEIVLTYPNDVILKRLAPLAAEIGIGEDSLFQCDVTDANSMDKAFEQIGAKCGNIDFLVHSIAFADKDELKGRYIETSLDNFLNSMNVSCYSLTALAKRVEPLMKNGGSIITMTYHGAQKAIPFYNVMGVAKAALEATVRYMAVDLGKKGQRVNAISAGPIRTLAAAGIGDFKQILNWNEANAPLKRNVTTDQVGNSAMYLLSDLASGVTGEIHYVDSGYNIMGMAAAEQNEDGKTVLSWDVFKEQ